VRHLLAVTRANDEALRTYQPQPWDGPLLLFCGTDGFASQFNDPELGWRELVPNTLEVVAVPGDHHGIMQGPGARIMASYLQGQLVPQAAAVD
jgi:thioesterase domain-containing protein